MSGIFRLADRMPSPWPGDDDQRPATPSSPDARGVFVEVSTGPLALADLIALMVAARRNCGRAPEVAREFAGCRPAIAFDHPDGLPRPVVSAARADAWVQAVVSSACPDTFADAPDDAIEVLNRRLRPPTSTVRAWAPERAPRGRAVVPPVVTVLLPRTRRSLARVQADASQVLTELPRTLAGGEPPIPPPGVALATSAGDAAAGVMAEDEATRDGFLDDVSAALASWRRAHERLGVVPPDRVTDSLTAHADVVRRRLARAADDEATTLLAHADKAATQLAPFALPQELSLSADWLADICGGPARLCAALCDVLDFDTPDHQLIELQ